ncbi:MAG TPA: hypothetical protein VGN86_02120 [Pyrinomonadaceae bacterium]|jgi:hypothetical protein|nr:hypothetical protein [Pyrinomonadaceae bacterium]
MKHLLTKFFDLLRKIGTQRRHQVAFGVSFGGLTLIVASHLLKQYQFGTELVWVILLEVGIACVIASIAEFILLEHVSQIFRQEVRDDIDLLSHCMQHQLIDILPPSSDEHTATVRAINSAVEKSRDDIRILACTLRDINHSDALIRGPLQKLLRRDDAVSVKFLLIDPEGAGVQTRISAEEGCNEEVEETLLYGELCTTINLIKNMINKAKGARFSMEARFYDTLPNFYMISTPTEIFIQFCHLGYNLAGGAPIVGDAPLFRFSSKSTMYQLANSHFSYIWDLRKNSSERGDGSIRIRTMDEVSPPYERRGRQERRARTARVESDRRVPIDRRERMAS